MTAIEPGEGYAARPTLLGTRHMASAGHYGAAHAAFAVLEAGGNAVDAAVAGGIALGVLQPDIVNVAGVAPILLRTKEGEVWTVAGLGPWPTLADADFLLREHGGIPEGVLRTVVPAAPDAWITALARFGTMRFGEVAGAAIRFAAEGFPVYPLLADMLALKRGHYARWPSSASVFLPGGGGGAPPRAGELFVQADLARTLRFMADEEASALARGSDRAGGLEAARAAFYRGDIAQSILRFHRAEGGWLRESDLADYRSPVERALSVGFAGARIFLCGPWCQGPVLGQALQLLDPGTLRAAGPGSAEALHGMVEALKLAFADREAHYGDPRFVEVPLARLLDPAYAAGRRGLIRPDRAIPGLSPAGFAAGGEASGPVLAGAVPGGAPRDTSYIAVVDRWGNAVSATPSDTSYDTPVVPGTGLCPSSRGSQSWLAPGHPSRLAPGKRPRLTPAPALAEGAGWVMPLGTPGGDVQAQAMLQVLCNLLLWNMEPQEAVERPRAATYAFPDSFWPHESFPDRLCLEARFPPEVGAALAARGHDVHWWPERVWRAGAVCAVRADTRRGVLEGAADPRRPSYAVGW